MSIMRKIVITGVAVPALVAASIATAPVASAATVNVNKGPVSTLGGAATLLSTPAGIARDDAGRLYVMDGAGLNIRVFAPNAQANAAPIRTIVAPALMGAIAVNPHGLLAVTLKGGSGVGSVLIYAPNESSPARIINGASTGLDEPFGVAVSVDGTTFVSNAGNSTITVFGPAADGDVAPSRTIAGLATGLSSPTGIVRRSDGQLVIANYGNHGILTFAANANGNVAPIRHIFGPSTDLQNPLFIALDSVNRIYQTSLGLNQVKVYAAGANGNAEPIVRNEGSLTGMIGPIGVNVLHNGQYSVANSGSNRITTYASFFGHQQHPVNQCMRVVFVPRNARTQLMKPNCRTTAGRTVHLRFSGNQNQGGVQRFRIQRTAAGAVFVRTFNRPFRFTASWSAAATVTHVRFSVIRHYSR